MQHKWNLEDDLVAVCMIKNGKNCLKYQYETTCSILDVQPNSMNMRLKNVEFVATDGKSGLSNAGKLTIYVWNNYKDMSDEAFIDLCNMILDLKKQIKGIVEV